MADLRIVDAPLLSTVKGTEKIPTGGEGNFSVSVDQVADFAKLKWVLATEGYVDNAVGNVQADLNLHKNNSSNPHGVTKLQVGLGNVDNTADLDKPVSNATQSAIITANSGKADKSYVDSQDQLKADKNTVEASLLLKADKVDLKASKIASDGGQNQQVINDFGGAKWYAKSGGYELGATVKLNNGDIVKSTIADNTANPNVGMVGWLSVGNTGEVESIADLLTTPNPKNSSTVFVKSLDGGHFTYNESKKTINDGVICYNGWARVTFESVYRSEWVGVTGIEGDDCVPKLKKLFEYVASVGGGTVIIQDGVHSLNTVHVDPTDGYVEYYAFGMYNNVTIEGTSRDSTIFKIKDDLHSDVSGLRYGIFVDNHRNDIVNFTARNFKVDFNGYNNLLTADRQGLFVVGLVWDAYKAKNITFDNIWCDKNATWNTFFFGAKCEDVTIKNCLFTEHSDSIANNVIHDHSTIYINGKNAQVLDCVFTMPSNPVSFISTAIEAHGTSTLCKGNTINGYGAPFLAASTEDNTHDDVLFIGNLAIGAQIGFAFCSMRGQLKAQFISNTVTLRKNKASTDNNSLRYAHAAIESMGAINSVHDISAAYSEIYVLNNVFEQEEPTDWNYADKFINVCHNVKEAKLFVSKGNTFKNFKGAALMVLAHRNWLEAQMVLDSNTYINCGSSKDYSMSNAAYATQDSPQAAAAGFDYNLLDSVIVSNETFLDCNYGVLVAKPNTLTAKTIDITGVKYLGSFIPPILITSPIDIVAGHSINIEYETTGFVSAGQTLGDFQGVSGKLKMNKWSASNVDDYLLKNFEYVKTAYYPWKMRALTNGAPSATGQVGSFPNKNGDRVDLLMPVLSGFSSFVRFEGGWYGTGKIDATNIVT